MVGWRVQGLKEVPAPPTGCDPGQASPPVCALWLMVLILGLGFRDLLGHSFEHWVWGVGLRGWNLGYA